MALGISAGAAMLALAAGGSAAVRDRAVSQELGRVGPSDSSLQVVWSGVPAQASASVSRLDAEARRALTSIVPGKPFGVSLFRQAQFGKRAPYLDLKSLNSIAFGAGMGWSAMYFDNVTPYRRKK